MKEIEAKILDINKEEIIKKLEDLGAKKIFEGEVISTFFKNENTLRLRKMGGKSYLTLKLPISKENIKIKEEYEVEISDFEETKKILINLGYDEEITLYKIRITYKLDNAKVEIDTSLKEYSHVPTLLEIEAEDEKTIIEIAEKLGYKKEDLKPWGFTETVNHYKK